jgi:serine/threonine protein kinase/tetratricopeptide (TPR) repeat protein
MIDSLRWEQLKSILATALQENSPAARIAVVERSCAHDADLLGEAESLLAEAESLLKEASDDLEACADQASTIIPRESISEIGQRVGAYVIISQIGRGGMGAVYLAARADGYFERQVAIKLLSRGPDLEELDRRFRAEREVLARLEHPNIAKLLDAGTTEHGVPYIVMEYVDGTPITRFVDENQLPVTARLELFLKVCAAVEVAHRQSVVHRDLKPNNILVTRDGEPKLLDFGIAKLVGTDANPLEITALGLERLTPISASPVRGESVTKVSDIYSLGALLYEMLTGSSPHRFHTSNPSRTELINVLCEQEPIAPSALAHEPRKRRMVRGNLDAILLCALQKDPSKRYSSVTAFADDIRRHLVGDLVQARSAGASRILRKTLHKRWAQFCLVVVGIALVCAGGLLLRNVWRPSIKPQGVRNTPSSLRPVEVTLAPEKSIAVLPFDNFSADKENSYFVDGVQDNILTDLAKVADLKVISRTSVASYRGATKDAREIGQALNVSHILEGSIQKSGGRIRVNAQLIDTRTRAEVWADHYDRKIDDLFILQSELAQTIVSRLKATLLPDEKAAIENRPTRDMLAYDLYLRAREEFYQYNYGRGIEFLENAVARDPKFAIAYAFLAEMQLYSYRFTAVQDSAHLVAAKTAADTALALAPGLAESHLAQAQYYYYGTRDFEAADRELTLAGSPTNNARFLDLTALVQRRLGHWKNAIRNGERAAELDPRNPFIINELLESYNSVRRFQEAEDLASRAIQLLPPTNNARWLLRAESFLGRGRLQDARTAAAEAPLARPAKINAEARLDLFARDYDRAAQHLGNMPDGGWDSPATSLLAGRIARAQGDSEKARASFQSARDRLLENLGHRPNDPGSLSDLSLADLGLGREQDALSEALRAVELVPISRDAVDGVTYATTLAIVYLATGQSDAALDELAKIAKLPCGPNYGELRFDPVWDELRTNPKFGEIMARAAEPPVYD